ncbi:hypothetical protein MRB53_023252 [Persea americana]|uniref:Uncharacterized protein n=1 Tax=Persea americana TaxID=3435 RepID=A0ACC2L8Z6_PERAE|nr:hypothetical protein MRB53_023252 [Persea americana]
MKALFLKALAVSPGNRTSSLKSGVFQGYVHINGGIAIGRIDSDFICATLDWWPPEKRDYGTCSWGPASLLNLVFSWAIGDDDSQDICWNCPLIDWHDSRRHKACIEWPLLLMFNAVDK